MYKTICVLLLLPLLAAGQVASMLSPWNAVERIAAGERIQVQSTDYKTLKGTFDHATADVVYLQHAGQTIEARRDGVRRLWRRKPGHGGRWAIVGGVAGAAALGVFGGTHLENKGGADFAGATAGVSALGAIIGTAVGYGIGHGKLELLYQAPKKAK